MNKEELINRLQQLNTEDFIWVIYIGIIILSWVSNKYERNYFIFNDLISKEKYKRIITIVFAILIIVYLYFLKNSIDDLKKIKSTDSDKKKNLVYLSFAGSLLIAISGFIFLYIALVDDDVNIELAFN